MANCKCFSLFFLERKIKEFSKKYMVVANLKSLDFLRLTRHIRSFGNFKRLLTNFSKTSQ